MHKISCFFVAKRWLLVAILTGLLVLLLLISPSERSLGGVVKLVYFHGALVRTAILLLILSLPFNLAALVFGRKVWANWGLSFSLTAVGIWLFHTLVSAITTWMAWGVLVAWFEPRTRFTFLLAGLGGGIALISWLIQDRRFTAAGFSLLTIVALVLLPQLGLVHHPLDPIGSSPSSAIRLFYAGIVAVAFLLGITLAVCVHTTFAARTSAKSRNSTPAGC